MSMKCSLKYEISIKLTKKYTGKVFAKFYEYNMNIKWV